MKRIAIVGHSLNETCMKTLEDLRLKAADQGIPVVDVDPSSKETKLLISRLGEGRKGTTALIHALIIEEPQTIIVLADEEKVISPKETIENSLCGRMIPDIYIIENQARYVEDNNFHRDRKPTHRREKQFGRRPSKYN